MVGKAVSRGHYMAGKVGLEVIQELHTGQNFNVRIVRVGET